MTEQVRKTEIASDLRIGYREFRAGQSNEAAARKAFARVPDTKKRMCAPPLLGRQVAGPAELAETREELLKKEALEEMFAASRKKVPGDRVLHSAE